jgi:spermidine synthase
MSASTPKDSWLVDSNGEMSLSLRYRGECLFREKSPYQTVEIFATETFGKVMAIDSMVMCTEADEAAYHESIVHVGMFSATDIRDVLVIGGGDGGTIRELLRHPGVERVTMVEIDDAVVRASKEHLPTLSCDFGHPKLDLRIDDGIAFVKNSPAEAFDLIIIDSSDPVGPAEGLFSESFYRDVCRCLRPNGIMTAQTESPIFNSRPFRELNQCLKTVFGKDKTHCYLVYIPTYPSGMWSFTYCAKGNLHPIANFDADRATAAATEWNLRYYNSNIHRAAFCLPTYIQQMIDG